MRGANSAIGATILFKEAYFATYRIIIFARTDGLAGYREVQMREEWYYEGYEIGDSRPKEIRTEQGRRISDRFWPIFRVVF